MDATRLSLPVRMVSLAEPPVITAIGASIKTPDEPYCAAGRWRLHFYASPVVMLVGGREHAIPSGWAALWPPQLELECRFSGRSLHACAHFQLGAGEADVAIPALQDLGERYARLEAAFLEAVRWGEDSPHRAEARLWDLLWQLVSAAPQDGPPRHPALERACSYISANLSYELTIESIATAARCSPNHLLRLFRKHLGLSTVAYLRRSRVQRATYLLRESDIPIKEIAAEVGIPDLHFFNKVLRSALGISPRAVRQQVRS
jgi:AraC-like DNA-binding protein